MACTIDRKLPNSSGKMDDDKEAKKKIKFNSAR